MIDYVRRALEIACSDLFNFLVFYIVYPSSRLLSIYHLDGSLEDFLVGLLVSMPTPLIVAIVWWRRAKFAERHGAAVAKAWAWSLTSFLVGWPLVILYSMDRASVSGASTAATLAPAILWFIGFIVMLAATCIMLIASGIARR